MRSLFGRFRTGITSLGQAIYNQRLLAEAVLVGLFLIQALRYVSAAVYARIGSASIYPFIDQSLLDPLQPVPGLLSPAVVQGEITVLLVALLLPLVALAFGHARVLGVVAVGVVALGRIVLSSPGGLSPMMGAALTLGGGLLYVAWMARHRASTLPYLFVLAFAIDQLLRASWNTLDPSLFGDYLTIQLVLSGLAAVLALFNLLRPAQEANPTRMLITLWGAIGLGALLFLQLALLAVPNAVAGRASTDYTLFAPLILLATLLPLIPSVRGAARGFAELFEASQRGWAWMLIIALLIVFGTRFQGVFAGIALTLAQFTVSLMWWWLVRPQREQERSVGGLWLLFTPLVYGLLLVFDLFTYEYAYVRNFAEPLTFLNPIVPPLLRGFRGLGLVVILLAVFFTALPAVQSRRIPWRGGRAVHTFGVGLIVALLTAYGAYLVRPPLVQAVRDVEQLRVATYNIHAGFNEFFYFDMEAIARTIQRSGANVVLLQEVEAGRLTSFGVDQTLWLARRLGMDRRFFATNEGLQGLAVLSNVEITENQNWLLSSTGQQTGVQRVVITPDEGTVTLYNTWLGLLLEGAGNRSLSEQEQDQQRQLVELISLVRTNSSTGGALGRLVVGGTFNNVPDSDVVQQMRATGLADPFDAQPMTESYTFIQTGRRARLDYLFTNLLALGAVVVDTRASDHALAVVGLQITR